MMRKQSLLITVLCIFIAFFFTGCSDSDPKVTDLSGNLKTTFSVNETAVFNNVNYTVAEIKYSNGDSWDKPSSGNNFVIVSIKIENKSDSKISYNVYDWKMLNSDGQYDTEAFTTIDSNTNLNSGELAPGGTKTGTIVFEEPKNTQSLKLEYYDNTLFDEKATFEFIIK